MGQIHLPSRFKTLSLTLLLALFTLTNNLSGQNPNIFGKWVYDKYFATISTYGEYELGLIKSSVLHIEKSKIYFEYPANFIIDTCHYTKVTILDFFDREIKEPNFSEDRSLAVIYNKIELDKIKRFDFNCEDNCLNTIYLKQDTLILNYCGGLTIFMKKKQ
jgi:hypothetical protein